MDDCGALFWTFHGPDVTMATEKRVIPSLYRSPAVNSGAGHVSIRLDNILPWPGLPFGVIVSAYIGKKGVHKKKNCYWGKKGFYIHCSLLVRITQSGGKA